MSAMVARLIAASGLDATGRPGTAAIEPEFRFDSERTVSEFARTLASLHARLEAAAPSAPGFGDVQFLDPSALVRARVEALERGELEGHRLSGPYEHMSVERLVEILDQGSAAAQTRASDPVLTHGAPTLATFRCHDGRAVGFVDWDAAAVADRYRDLAVAAHSVAFDFDPALLPVFFDAYGLDRVDVLQLDWYSLVAELTP